MKRQAQFVERNNCINCRSTRLFELSRGRYIDEPLRSFLAGDPWGVDPLQFLQTAEWSLVKCVDCSLIFHRRILNEEWNERRFSEWMSAEAIRDFEKRFSEHNGFAKSIEHTIHILRIEKLTRTIRGDSPVRLLDFGCGHGEFLSSCLRFGFDGVGVDRSTARREKAVTKIEPSIASVTGPFHAVTLFETLEHLDDPAGVLEALHPLMADEGILILETPDCSGVSGIKAQRDYRLVHPLEHINAFSHETMKSIAKRCGFTPISRPTVYVTSEVQRVIRTIVKGLIGKGEKSTRMYFKKTLRAAALGPPAGANATRAEVRTVSPGKPV